MEKNLYKNSYKEDIKTLMIKYQKIFKINVLVINDYNTLKILLLPNEYKLQILVCSCNYKKLEIKMLTNKIKKWQ
mgnify:CR=1 FL=1